MLKRKKQPTADALSEPTDVRFGMRGLLAAMLVVAVASAALGPFFRNLAPDKRGSVTVTWCTALALVLAGVGFLAWYRIRLERIAGRRLQSLTPRARIGFRIKQWLTVTGGLCWIGFGLYYLMMMAQLAHGSRVPTPYWPRVVPCLASGSAIAMGIAMIWWGRAVQLREYAILRGLRLLRWTHVTAHRWQDDDIYLEGVDQRHRDMQLTVAVDEKDREIVSRLIAQKLGRQSEASPDIALGNEEFSEKKHPLVRIRSGTDVTMRGMATGFTVYVLIVVFVAARPWGTPPTQFVTGFSVGFFIVALTWLAAAMRAGESGPPLVRVVSRWDWPSILVSLIVTVGSYFVVQQFVFPSLVVAVGLGICSGVGAATLMEIMVREKFDLCENGIVLVKWRFLPWRSVRMLRWERNSKGSLLLRSGWRRLAAIVPAEQCDAVERVLAEKLGGDASSTTPGK